MMSSYTLRAQHAGRNAYWEATILAPDLLTAALFLKKRARAEDMPTIHKKNGKRYTRTGNRAYYRNVKLDLLRAGKRTTEKKKREALQNASDAADGLARARFGLCKILEESPYILT